MSYHRGMVAIANADSLTALRRAWKEKVLPLLGRLPARQEDALFVAGAYLEQMLAHGRSDHRPPRDLQKAKAALQKAKAKR